MASERSSPGRAVRSATLIVLLIFCLIGIALFASSVAISHEYGFWKEFTKELGIVLLTVCGVSIIYELFVAEKHFAQFSASLRQQVERGETNAAVCERLGILRIFTTRAQYEAEYPLMQIASAATTGSAFRMIAKSLFLAMTKSDAIKDAVRRGARVELCCLDPKVDSPALRPTAGLEPPDIASALSRFKNDFSDWLKREQPPGTVELRYHEVDLFDSYFAFVLNGQALAAWDLSFGADVTAKRVVLLDSGKPLGSDLQRRYQSVWDAGTPKFRYASGAIALDELPVPW